MLLLNDICFNFPDSPKLFNHFSFQAEPGNRVLIKGASGSGKTTLLNIICGVIPKVIKGNYSGTVKLNDLDINSLSLPQVSPHVSLLMQDPDLQMFFPTVEQEVAFGPENLKVKTAEIRNRISDALQMLGIEHLRYKETASLSFGEKKLVALASLLALDPEVFLLDEPAAGISSNQINNLKKVIDFLAGKDKLIFIAEHQGEFLELPDKTIELI
jgi:energy-coupling factor transport system ATP-binding protein